MGAGFSGKFTLNVPGLTVPEDQKHIFNYTKRDLPKNKVHLAV